MKNANSDEEREASDYRINMNRRAAMIGMKSLLKQVRHHKSRGRDAATTAMWMELPMSKINEALEIIKAEDSKI